jgi:tRNA A37 threonylcarbamoyladenosine biosynthesis protein TsaE
VEWPERLRLVLPEAWQLELAYQGEGRKARLTPPHASAMKASTSCALG